MAEAKRSTRPPARDTLGLHTHDRGRCHRQFPYSPTARQRRRISKYHHHLRGIDEPADDDLLPTQTIGHFSAKYGHQRGFIIPVMSVSLNDQISKFVHFPGINTKLWENWRLGAAMVAQE